MGAFEQLQSTLGTQLDAQAAAVESVVVVLPSHSMPQRLLTHHASMLPALEHRALLDGLQVGRSPATEVIVVASAAPPESVLAYYASLARPDSPEQARRRVSCFVVPDDSARGVSAKLLDRPDLVTALRERIDGRPVVIDPWNVTRDEVAVAVALDAPLNGGPCELWPLGFKSASRRLFREAGVPVPAGAEDVRDGAEVAAAIIGMRRDRPLLDLVVVKLDNSGAAEGNWVMATRDEAGRALSPADLVRSVETSAPAWFLADLADGGVVEEMLTGVDVTSPSGQAEIRPDGKVVVLSTHEQVLGGASGQVFTGSRFPADPAYAAAIAEHTTAVARRLAELGAVGCVAVDFVARRVADRWGLAAVDLNLRKGGTTHSYAALRHLVPGAYDPAGRRWVADTDGSPRYYRSSDGVGAEGSAWAGMRPADAARAVAAAGLSFEPSRGSGVVLHMFPSLRRDGSIGVTAIGRSAAEAEDLFDAVPAALDAQAHG